jgi:hypothetical protein
MDMALTNSVIKNSPGMTVRDNSHSLYINNKKQSKLTHQKSLNAAKTASQQSGSPSSDEMNILFNLNESTNECGQVKQLVVKDLVKKANVKLNALLNNNTIVNQNQVNLNLIH